LTLELLLFGLIAGFTGGFFGIGGGMMLIPMLLFIGYDMKSSIAISIMQMVFTSIFGSYLNFKNNKSFIKDGIYLGLGGFSGGLVSGFIITNISNISLQYLFLSIVAFAVYRVSKSSDVIQENTIDKNIFTLFFIGLVIGIIAMSIGVGGSVMLTPILVSYLLYNLKEASSMGLFFVIFSSIAGFISLSFNSSMLYYEGTIVGLASLFGVYFGIKLKNNITFKSYKTYLIFMYVSIFISVAYNIISLHLNK
jgi:uncharacterized membrane protein YfcA